MKQKIKTKASELKNIIRDTMRNRMYFFMLDPLKSKPCGVHLFSGLRINIKPRITNFRMILLVCGTDFSACIHLQQSNGGN